MQRDADAALSNNEREFIIQALKEDRRIDGRSPYEMREPKFQFSLDDSSCTVLLGRTRVMTVVTATLEAPYPDRPNEGAIRFNVEFSPMASPAFEAGRPGEEAIEVARLIERGLRESRAVDTEALVVVSGRKVWHLRVDVHVLDHCGNLVDAAGLSALGALMAFRRPDVTVADDGQAVTVHSPEVREPLPLSIHHLPVPISFAFFEGGSLLVVDPGLKEEAASAGGLTVTLNSAGELCAVQKAAGVGLPAAEVMRCIRLAGHKVEDLTTRLKKALEAHAVARVQARVRRRAPPAAPAAPAQPAAAAGAAGALPAPVVDMLRRLEEEEAAVGEEEEAEDAQMAAADGEGGGASAAGRELPEPDGMEMGDEAEEGREPAGQGGAQEGAAAEAAAPPAPQQQPQQQQQREAPPASSSAERRKEKRKRRAAGGGGSPGAGRAPDSFELIASMIADAGGKGAAPAAAGGLEGAVRQGGGKKRTPGGKKRDKSKGGAQ